VRYDTPVKTQSSEPSMHCAKVSTSASGARRWMWMFFGASSVERVARWARSEGDEMCRTGAVMLERRRWTMVGWDAGGIELGVYG
jgi:hypothetical protein